MGRIITSYDFGANCTTGHCFCPINLSVVLFLFSFEVLMNHLLEDQQQDWVSITQGPRGSQGSCRRPCWNQSMFPQRSSVSYVLTAFFFKPLRLRSLRSIQVEHSRCLGDIVSWSIPQAMVNKYPSSLCLGWENSEMCYARSCRYPAAQAPVAIAVHCSWSHPLLLFSFPCFTSPFPYPWFLWSDLQ